LNSFLEDLLILFIICCLLIPRVILLVKLFNLSPILLNGSKSFLLAGNILKNILAHLRYGYFLKHLSWLFEVLLDYLNLFLDGESVECVLQLIKLGSYPLDLVGKDIFLLNEFLLLLACLLKILAIDSFLILVFCW